MNGKIHFKDWDVYLAWNNGAPFDQLIIRKPGQTEKVKALCGNIMKNNVSNFFGYYVIQGFWTVAYPNKVTCKRCIAEMKKLGL